MDVQFETQLGVENQKFLSATVSSMSPSESMADMMCFDDDLLVLEVLTIPAILHDKLISRTTPIQQFLDMQQHFPRLDHPTISFSLGLIFTTHLILVPNFSELLA